MVGILTVFFRNLSMTTQSDMVNAVIHALVWVCYGDCILQICFEPCHVFTKPTDHFTNKIRTKLRACLVVVYPMKIAQFSWGKWKPHIRKKCKPIDYVRSFNCLLFSLNSSSLCTLTPLRRRSVFLICWAASGANHLLIFTRITSTMRSTTRSRQWGNCLDWRNQHPNNPLIVVNKQNKVMRQDSIPLGKGWVTMHTVKEQWATPSWMQITVLGPDGFSHSFLCRCSIRWITIWWVQQILATEIRKRRHLLVHLLETNTKLNKKDMCQTTSQCLTFQ